MEEVSLLHEKFENQGTRRTYRSASRAYDVRNMSHHPKYVKKSLSPMCLHTSLHYCLQRMYHLFLPEFKIHNNSEQL